MNKILFALILSAGLFPIEKTYSQDVDINILTVPASVPLGSTSGVIEVDICNVDGGSTVVPTYKLRPLITGNSLINITGADLPAGWAIISNNGTSIAFTNGTDNTLAPADCRQIVIHFTATGVGSNASITGRMEFGNGSAPGAADGAQTVNNFTSNDLSNTAITVTTPLPVSLAFSAQVEDSRSLLRWSTSSEINNRGFDVERSADGTAWQQIGHSASKSENGNSTTKLDYTFYDRQPLAGKNIYRLKQTDKDGSITYSVMQELSFDQAGSTVVGVFPNPTRDKVSLSAGDWNKLKEVRVTDLYGRVLYYSADLKKGVDMSSMPPAVYLLQVIHTDGSMSGFKVTKL